MNGSSGAIDAASEPKETHGRRTCLRTLSSDMRKNTTPMRVRSSTTRSRMVLSGSVPRIFAASASVLPVSGLSASVLNSTISSRSGEPAARHRFSQPSAGRLMSATMRDRVGGSWILRKRAS